MKIQEMIIEIQQKLGVEADGKAGPETWGAIYKRIVDRSSPADIGFTERADRANARSEKVIATLRPAVQPLARALYFKAKQNGITINIISGLRTYAEQDALFAQGRSKRGPVVTNARGGFSNHNFGIAFDVGVFEGSKYLGNSPKYKAVGVLGSELGLEWGGNWTSLKDEPHFQLRPHWSLGLRERDMLAELRRRKAAGIDFDD